MLAIAPCVPALESLSNGLSQLNDSIDAWMEVHGTGASESTGVVLVVEEALRERDLRLCKSRQLHLTHSRSPRKRPTPNATHMCFVYVSCRT